MNHKPPTRVGRTLGLAFLLALALLELGLVVLILAAPITPLTIMRGWLVALNLALMVSVLNALANLHGANYSLERNAITIHWGTAEQIIPLANVEGILQGMDLGRLAQFRGLRLPGYWFGRGKLEGIGWAQFYSSTPLERQLVIKTSAGAYAISPENPDKFMDLFASQMSLGPPQKVDSLADEPGRWEGGLFSDRWALILLAAGGLGNLLMLWYITARFHHLPARFSFPSMMQTGPAGYLLVLARVGTAGWVLNGVLGAVVYQRWGEKAAAYLLWGAALALQLLLLGAFWGLVRA